LILFVSGESASGEEKMMALASMVSIAKVGIFSVWLLSPLVLGGLAMRELKNSEDARLRSRAVPVIALALLLGIWFSFILLFAIGQIGGFGTHYLTTRSADWFLLGSLTVLVISITSKVAKGKLALASLLVFALWFGSEMVA